MRETELAQVTVSKHLMEHAFKTASSKIVNGGGITTTLDPWQSGSVFPYSSAQRKQKERERPLLAGNRISYSLALFCDLTHVTTHDKNCQHYFIG